MVRVPSVITATIDDSFKVVLWMKAAGCQGHFFRQLGAKRDKLAEALRLCVCITATSLQPSDIVLGKTLGADLLGKESVSDASGSGTPVSRSFNIRGFTS